MNANPVLDISLREVLRPELALQLEQLLKIYTVGNFLRAWKSPSRQRNIEQLFDTPHQARHAAQVCATWLGLPVVPTQSDAQLTGCWASEPDTRRVAA